MAKTTAADAEYQQGQWHLAQILRVRWASTPGVGTDAPPVLAIQIKLAITHRWPPPEAEIRQVDLVADRMQAAREDSAATRECRYPNSDVDPEAVNGAVVVYVACDVNRRPLTPEGSLFLVGLGVERTATRADLEHQGEWLKCQFGPPDSVYGFQSIIKWEPVASTWATNTARRVPPTAYSRPKPELKLEFPEPGRAIQDGVELDFAPYPFAWFVLRRLALRYDSSYRTVDLGIDAWAEAGLKSPSSASVHQAVSQLRQILKSSGLAIPRPTSRGYRLKLRAAPAP